MGGQGHFNAIVVIAPFGVMAQALGLHGDAAHETECLIEIGENKCLGDGVAAADLVPAGEAGGRLSRLGFGGCFGALAAPGDLLCCDRRRSRFLSCACRR